MRVEVADATGTRIEVRTVTLAPGTGATVVDALDAAGFPTTPAAVAVFGEVVNRAHVLEDGDRVDLLREPLIDQWRHAASAHSQPVVSLPPSPDYS